MTDFVTRCVLCWEHDHARIVQDLELKKTVQEVSKAKISCSSQLNVSRRSRQSDSNRRPADYKSAALPAELCRQGRPRSLAYKAFLNKLSISRTGARA